MHEGSLAVPPEVFVTPGDVLLLGHVFRPRSLKNCGVLLPLWNFTIGNPVKQRDAPAAGEGAILFSCLGN